VKQLKINIPGNEEIVNKKIKEEFTLKNATLYGGYNLFSDYLAINGVDRLLFHLFRFRLDCEPIKPYNQLII